MAKRSYSEKTLKVLFSRCGNQCAHPDCTNPVSVLGDGASKDVVLGQICHIYAASDKGPRGKPGLTPAQRNAPENLLVMCGVHHPWVDTQYDKYPADLLQKWKREHEAKFSPETAEAIREQKLAQRLAFTVGLTDQQIEAEVLRIKRARHLGGYPMVEKALAVAANVEGIELAGGSKEVRSRALAWCARFLAKGENLPRAKALLELSGQLGPAPEGEIAKAFIVAAEAESSASALALLAPKNTPEAFTAMLRIVTNERGQLGAYKWVRDASLQLSSFDGDGKLNLIMNELWTSQWDDAYVHAKLLTPIDYEETPVLHYATACALLAHTAPEGLRSQGLFQVPFDAARVPLSDDPTALQDRKRAIEHFEKVRLFAEECGATEAARSSLEMSLWLRLRDADLHDAAREDLREKMRDETLVLRLFPLAAQFGPRVDLEAIEKRINERVALTGKGTIDEAAARMALAMCRAPPAEVVEYISTHRDQLYEFLDHRSLIGVEIELFCRSGQVGSAKALLQQAIEAGFSDTEYERLQRMIAEAEGADPAAERRRLYEKTGELRDLANLVSFLEDEKAWQDLSPLAEALFDQTHSADDALRVTRALTNAGEHKRLLEFLQRIPDIVALEDELQSLLAWTLYRDGQFTAASAMGDVMLGKRTNPNDRSLFVNLAIASGQWDGLVAFTTEEWRQRDQRTPEELLRAGQLAQAVNAPHARDLIVAATEAAPENPYILAPAYFHATSAGWENDPVVGNWLLQAADKSKADGPLKSVTMKELFELKPDWDRRRDDIQKLLNEGRITVSGAAAGLNQSMIQNCLLKPAANRLEPDARRRGLVYAFSGARPPTVTVELTRIALDLTAIFTLAQLKLLPTVVSQLDRVMIPDQLLVWLFQERQRASFHQPSRVKDAHILKRHLADGSLKIFAPEQSAKPHLYEQVGFDLAAMLETASQSPGDAYVIRSAPVHRVGSVMEENADLSEFEQQLCSCQAVVEALRLKGMITASEEKQALSYLQLHEQRWPNEPRLRDGATLYLDDLSTTYLRTVGVLGKLKAAGFTAYVTKSLDDHDNQLLAYESFSDEQLATIEGIRSVLTPALIDGRVETIASPERDSEDAQLQAQLNFLSTDKSVDAFVVDDRFVNRWLTMAHGGRQTPIITSLDLVQHLVSKDAISEDDEREHRTNLRRSGYTFVPVLEEELTYHLLQAPLDEGALVETAELRAIRESAARLILAKTLQGPHELSWLQQYTLALIHTARAVWEATQDSKEAEARCEWILDQLDTRVWSALADPGSAGRFSRASYAGILHALSYAPDITLRTQNDPYHQWIDERLLGEIKETEPEIFEQVVASATAVFGKAVNDTEEPSG